MPLFRRSETPATDNARTRRLLDNADAAFEGEADSDFARTVVDGLMSDVVTRPYPPPGHGYPRR